MVINPEQLIQGVLFSCISRCSFIFFVILLLCHLLFGNSNKSREHLPTLFYKESAFSRFLIDKIPRIRSPYYPPIWAYNPYVQRLVSYLLPIPEIYYERQYLQLKDRGLIALDWVDTSSMLNQATSSSCKKHHHLLLLLPNLTDNALSVGDLSLEAIKRGFRLIVFNRRGHGNCPLSTPKLQPYGDPSDLRQAVKYIRCKHPRSNLLVVGYGTGADLLLAYLGEYGSSACITAGVAISPLYDPERLYEFGFSQPYEFFRLLSFRKFLSRHVCALANTIDTYAAFNSRSISDFERIVYWKMCNCNNWDQYWEKNAPLRDADEMSIPLLFISSKDDPVVPEDVIPYDIFHVYPQLILVKTENGGHCCFLEAGRLKPQSWANLLALDFLKVTLEFSSYEERITKSLSAYSLK